MACGPFGNLGDWIVPDKPFGLDISGPCTRHDARYENPEGMTKEEIDYLFYEEILLEVAKSAWYLRPLHRGIAWVYYKVVCVGGLAWKVCRIRESYEATINGMREETAAVKQAFEGYKVSKGVSGEG